MKAVVPAKDQEQRATTTPLYALSQITTAPLWYIDKLFGRRCPHYHLDADGSPLTMAVVGMEKPGNMQCTVAADCSTTGVGSSAWHGQFP